VLEAENGFFTHWYRRDDNVIPAVYLLQPRIGVCAAYEVSKAVEVRLQEILLSAISHFPFSLDTLLKYNVSTTEREIVCGALNSMYAREHVLCFFRKIEGLSQEYSQGFGNPDAEANQKQVALKARLRQHLGTTIFDYTASLQEERPSTDRLDTL